MEFSHQTFTIDLEQEHHCDLCHIVESKYDIEEYLIAFEPTNDKGEDKPHFHFIVFTTYKNVTNLLQYLVNKYNLRNTSGKQGGKRRYARLKQPIRNLERLKVYCCKHKNVKSTYSHETLEELYKQSFKKNPRTLKLKCQAFVEEATSSQNHVSLEDIRIIIIKWCMQEKVHIRKTLIDAYVIWTCQNTEFTRLLKTPHDIYALMYGNY